MNAVTSDKKPKNRKLKPFDVLDNYRKKLGLKPNQMIQACGYMGNGSWSKWERTGWVPEVITLAAECLVRRHGNSSSVADSTVLITKFQNGQLKGTRSYISDSISKATLNGQDYWMIPVIKD